MACAPAVMIALLSRPSTLSVELPRSAVPRALAPVSPMPACTNARVHQRRASLDCAPLYHSTHIRQAGSGAREQTQLRRSSFKHALCRMASAIFAHPSSLIRGFSDRSNFVRELVHACRESAMGVTASWSSRQSTAMSSESALWRQHSTLASAAVTGQELSGMKLSTSLLSEEL